MKKTAIFIIAFFLFCGSLEAAYKVYLKNGSVLRGVKYYEETDSMIRLTLPGGTVEFPKSDILRIEKSDVYVEPEGEGTEPKEKIKDPSEAPKPGANAGVQKEIAELKAKIEQIDGQLAEFNKKDDEASKLQTELDDVQKRIDFLFKKGRAASIQAGKGEANWLVHLSPQEREWVRINTVRENELKAELKEYEDERKKLSGGKEYLTNERASLENRIRSLSRK